MDHNNLNVRVLTNLIIDSRLKKTDTENSKFLLYGLCCCLIYFNSLKSKKYDIMYTIFIKSLLFKIINFHIHFSHIK